PVPPCGTLAKGNDLSLAGILELYPNDNIKLAILLVRELRPTLAMPPTFAERLTERIKGVGESSRCYSSGETENKRLHSGSRSTKVHFCGLGTHVLEDLLAVYIIRACIFAKP